MNPAPNDCNHLEGLAPVEPTTKDVCLECTEMGDTWFHLRVCLVCGHVGCCDNSKNKHATAHFEATQHAVIQSYEPAETWRYCYAHGVRLADADDPLRR